jgi:mannosyltransferase OCH1-like enzyme
MGSPAEAGALPGSPASSSSSSSNAAAPSSGFSYQQQQLTAPKLIPRVIHQTYRSMRLPASAKQFMHSWQERNGEAWQVRLYSDEACLNFVRREFPEYFEAYMNLPKEVERADFFRCALAGQQRAARQFVDRWPGCMKQDL